MQMAGTFGVAVAVMALLSTGCSTLTPRATLVTDGCSMLPQDVRYIDARVQVVELTQDRAGCHFHAVAKSAAAARAQTRLLGKLAKLRCEDVIVDDSSADVAAQDTNAAGVTMRITLRTNSGRACKPSKVTTGDPPAPNAREAGIYRTHMSPPHYPREAFREGRQGEATVVVLIAGKRETIGAVLDRSSGYDDMDEAAVAAAQNWRFEVVGETPEISLVRAPVNFGL